MHKDYRQIFNKNFTQEKYRHFLARLNEECGVPVEFRVSETPIFLSHDLVQTMERSGQELIQQLMSNSDYLKRSFHAIPYHFVVPNQTPHPLFIAIDFSLAEGPNGDLVPRLIEMQGFPSLYAYQATLCNVYREIYGLPSELRWLLNDLTLEEYYSLLRRAILGLQAPENVILMELDPLKQKTLPDFVLTERLCGIRAVNIRDIIRDGAALYYLRDGKRVPIYRIYNRVIADDLIRSDAKLSFSFREDLNVEWAGHPNWFFRISKFSLPFLNHPTVPKTYFLSDLRQLPDDMGNWVLKPLYSFAGRGVKVGPSQQDIEAIPDAERDEYILQERVKYSDCIATPHGGTKVEIRILYLWLDKPMGVCTIVRMGRGVSLGVDHNKNMEWVGGSAAFFSD